MQTDDKSGPSLSVVLVTPERFRNIRRSMRHLRAQTVRDRLEIVIVAPSEDALADREGYETEGFYRVKTVAVGEIENVDKASAHGIYQASAPVVAPVEDHAYPDPGWAEALIGAHQEPWGVVGSTVLNANPESALSWTNLLIAYGPCTEPNVRGAINALPGHNISYKRAALMEYGSKLESKMGRDGGLLSDLQAKGYKFYLESEARISHLNPSLLSSTVQLRFNAGRLYGVMRAQEAGWSKPKRWMYAASGPLIPFIRLLRVWQELFGGGKRKSLMPRVLPALTFGLVLDGAGQMFGYAFGPGNSTGVLANFEMDRLSQLSVRDRRAFAV